MNKTILYPLLLSFILIISLVRCSDEDKVSVIQKNSLIGVVEKGPFVNGSTVIIYELDKDFAQTGKTFAATTNNEGYFEINNSIELVSNYVKLVVNGFYFNEVTGNLSQAPITLEAVANIKNKNSLNANLLTHLETKRVMYLVEKENVDFDKAKKQAQKELLTCFLIKDKEIVTEDASIIGNNTQANILIAVSSILLRSIEVRNQADAEFTQLINTFRDAFEKNGEITESLKKIIKDSSYKLNYKTVKNNIEERYQELGKDVVVGNFHYFIDGEGKDQLSENDYPIDDAPIVIEPEDFFNSDENFKAALTNTIERHATMCTKDFYLFDALFTHAVTNINNDNDLSAVYEHHIDPQNEFVNTLFSNYYKAISQENIIIEKGEKQEFQKYKYASMVYRAYQYLNMVELWGDVPLIIKTLDLSEIYVSRTDKKVVLNHIIENLLEAEAKLPDNGNYPICSGYLASGLLARAFMQLGDYASALIYAQKVMASNKFSLCANYDDIYSSSGRESLFSFIKTEYDQPVFNDYISKGDETPLMRLAEVILIAAEANLKQNNIQEAVSLINQLRKRNKRTLLESIVSQKTVEEALLYEWENDLSKEGVWFNTLKRFGKAEEVLQIPSYMTLLPIPRREMGMNPNMTQNPGYK